MLIFWMFPDCLCTSLTIEKLVQKDCSVSLLSPCSARKPLCVILWDGSNIFVEQQPCRERIPSARRGAGVCASPADHLHCRALAPSLNHRSAGHTKNKPTFFTPLQLNVLHGCWTVMEHSSLVSQLQHSARLRAANHRIRNLSRKWGNWGMEK